MPELVDDAAESIERFIRAANAFIAAGFDLESRRISSARTASIDGVMASIHDAATEVSEIALRVRSVT